jgi:uncharacterized membrane protein YjjP (DUF1212 family)
MSGRRLHTNLLLQAGRLLLEYNESTGAIHRALSATATALTDEACQIAVSYHGVSVALGEESLSLEPVRELHYDMALQARVHQILDRLRRREIDASAALAGLAGVEADTPRHSRGLVAVSLGASAAGLAGLLGADRVTAAVAGVATALGLLARQELGRRRFNFLALPFTAALIGAALGGPAIRLGWARSPELVLIVPALMLVPGPHLINGLLDLIDNYLPMSLSRLGLAMGILLASALGIVVGVELTLPGLDLPESGVDLDHLNVVSDVLLAGVVTCGFAMFYNTAWRHLWMAMAGGMAGHGLRFLATELGCRPEVATFLGGITVGALAAWMGRVSRTPVAVIAFAGAVTMLPGLNLYRALAGALRLARLAEPAGATIAPTTFGNAFLACAVLSALALGLIVGARIVFALGRERS